MRPAGKARGASIWGIFERRVTRLAGMQRRPNAEAIRDRATRVADVVMCGHCGASAPTGRALCGRCGSSLAGAAVARLEIRSGRPMRLIIVGAPVVACAIAIGMPAGWRQKPAPVQASATAASSGQVTSPGRKRDEPLVPASEFVAADASRSGVAAYNGGNLATAVTQFTTAVDADPNNAEALNNLGQVLVKSGRAREALPYFDRAIAVSDGVWAYHFNRARAYAELQEWRRAVSGYTEAARLFPDDYVTQFNLAKARQADGDLSGATEGYARAVELAPGQADFHLWYGQALDLSGRQQDAAAAYRRFLELEPGGSQAEKVKARLAELSSGAGEAPPKAS